MIALQTSSGNATSIQGTPVDATPPATAGAVPVYDGTTKYVARRLTLDDVDPAFSITSFSGGNIIKEIGDTLSSPVVFTVAYSALPSSASIQDDQGNGALALSSPFTSGSYPHSYTKTANNAAIVWTVTAVGATVKTLTNTGRFRPRIYYGTATPPGSYNAAFAHSLQSSVLSPNNTQTVNYTATAGQKCYFISPASYGTAAGTYLNFAFGATLVATFTETNGFGVSQTYNIIESNLAGLGTLNGVAWA